MGVVLAMRIIAMGRVRVMLVVATGIAKHVEQGRQQEQQQQFSTEDSSPRSMPTGIVYGSSCVSSSSTYCASTLDTHLLSANANQ